MLPTDTHPSSFRFGVACAVLAHVIWGLFPLYWRMLGSLSAAAITSHRIVWALLSLTIICLVVPRLRRNVLRRHDTHTIVVHSVAASMLALNWLAFLYAVNSDQVLQASLGYYINPLVNVLLGVVILHERLRTSQKIAIGFAAVGVAVMAIGGNEVPWISLVMATSFGFYGLMKKKARLGPLEGLTIETAVMFPFAVAYLMYTSPPHSIAGSSELVDSETGYSAIIWTLLIVGGVITIVPLSLFAAAAKRVPLSVLGILQYIGPTMQWIVGAVVLSEAVGTSKLIGFALVWAGVLVFITGERVWNRISPTRNADPLV